MRRVLLLTLALFASRVVGAASTPGDPCVTALLAGDLDEVPRESWLFAWETSKPATRPNLSAAVVAQIEIDDARIRRELRTEPRELTDLLFKLVALKARGVLANEVLHRGQKYRLEQFDRNEVYRFPHNEFQIDLGGMRLINIRSRRELIVNYRQAFAAALFGDFGLEKTVFRIEPWRLRDLQL